MIAKIDFMPMFLEMSKSTETSDMSRHFLLIPPEETFDPRREEMKCHTLTLFDSFVTACLLVVCLGPMLITSIL